jgi:histidinol-phosphatase (PHP family)
MNKSYPEMNPGPEMLAMMAERRIPVVIGSDSHTPTRVADGFVEALEALETAGYESVSLFRERQRRDLPIASVKSGLRNEALSSAFGRG